MSGTIRPVADGGQGASSSPVKRSGSAGAPETAEPKDAGELRPARDDDGGATEGAATVGPRTRPTGAANAEQQAVDGSRKVKRHIPRPDPDPVVIPKPIIKPGMVVVPPLPGSPPGGVAHPAPSVPGPGITPARPDQSITPAQEAEIRETLIEHGIDENEVDRIVEQLEDGTPVGMVLVPGGMPAIAAGGAVASLVAQLQAGLEALGGLHASAATPVPPTHR